jgi:hypothetical protein
MQAQAEEKIECAFPGVRRRPVRIAAMLRLAKLLSRPRPPRREAISNLTGTDAAPASVQA